MKAIPLLIFAIVASPRESLWAAGKPDPENSVALQLLRVADAGAGNLQGVDRAYAYWLIAEAYRRVNPKEEQRALKKSCEAALIPDPGGQDTMLRQRVQLDCLRRMMSLQSKTGLELLGRADPDVRQQVFAAGAATFARKGDTEAALTLLSSEISRGAHYPYGRALEVIKAMPAEDSVGRDRVFAQALAHYREKHDRFDVNPDDLGTLVVRLWREISPGLILQAMDALLEVAGEEAYADSHLELTLKSGSEGVSFGSLYQYRLFQLLPVLRQLDPERADDLLKKNTPVNSALQKYTDGLQSLSRTYSDNPRDDEPFSMALQKDSGPATGLDAGVVNVLRLQAEQQAAAILDSAQENPETALQNALLLQDSLNASGSTKLDLLLAIAQTAAKQSRRIAIVFLREASKLPERYPELMRCRYLVFIADAYLRIGEVDGAQDALDQVMKSVTRLYAADADSDDPNRALKSAWPSTVVARAGIALAGRVSTGLAEQLTLELPDPDLRVFARIDLANSKLRVPGYPALIHRRHKLDRNDRVDVFPVPTAQE